jgi:hypothetical protein
MTKQLLASVRPRDEVGKLRRQLAVDQLTDLIAIDKRIADINRQLKTAVAKVDTNLGDIFGVGPVVTAMILGEVRSVARFRAADHFASYNATAPGLWGSGGDATPCVNLRGNRNLNSSIHVAALSQMRHLGPGRDYYLRKLAAGKTTKGVAPSPSTLPVQRQLVALGAGANRDRLGRRDQAAVAPDAGARSPSEPVVAGVPVTAPAHDRSSGRRGSVPSESGSASSLTAACACSCPHHLTRTVG